MQAIVRSTIGDVIRRSARRVPSALALAFEARSWTYRELDDASTRVAAQLLAVGLVKGDRVAAFGKNSDAFVLLWLGCTKAGLVHVPVNYALAGRELAYLLRQSGARAVFADAALQPAVDACGVSVEIGGSLRNGVGALDVLAWGLAEGPLPIVDVDVSDDDVAQLLYTSGTTSEPKGAILTHRSLIHHYASSAMAIDARASDRQLHALPLYHSAQMHVFLMPSLALGAPNWLLETPDPARVLDAMATHAIDSFFAAPTVWIALLALIEKDAARASALKKAYYGASIMPTPVLQRLRGLLPALGFYNCFGQSEIGPLATVLRPEEHEARPASAGRAVPFVDLRVVDDDMVDVPAGEVGEVVYRSPQLCLGYWDKPDETTAAFEGGWFHSGDLARYRCRGVHHHRRPQEGHHQDGRHRGVVARGRGSLVHSPARARGRGDRIARRALDRGRHRRRRARWRRLGRRGRARRACSRPPGPVQGAEAHSLRRRLAEKHRGQAAEARAALTIFGHVSMPPADDGMRLRVLALVRRHGFKRHGVPDTRRWLSIRLSRRRRLRGVRGYGRRVGGGRRADRTL